MLAISVDPPAKSREVVQRFHLEFPILSDAKREVIRAYGLVHAQGALDESDIAIPAHILIGRDGRILWRHIARRVQDRPDPAEDIEQIRRAAQS